MDEGIMNGRKDCVENKWQCLGGVISVSACLALPSESTYLALKEWNIRV